jgi:hypothetical protein
MSLQARKLNEPSEKAVEEAAVLTIRFETQRWAAVIVAGVR